MPFSNLVWHAYILHTAGYILFNFLTDLDITFINIKGSKVNRSEEDFLKLYIKDILMQSPRIMAFSFC